MLKGIFPRIFIYWILARRQSLDIRIAILGSYGRWSTALYCALFSAEFRREMHVVSRARRRYYSALSGYRPSSYLLRRNIHRLEKGLVMEPPRLLFEAGYIRETANDLNLCAHAQILSDREERWARGVLD